MTFIDFSEKCKAEPSHADEILENLCGEWRLIFTTGTDKSKSVNYFPIKVRILSACDRIYMFIQLFIINSGCAKF